MIKSGLLFIGVLLLNTSIYSQNTDANVFGDVQSKGEHIPFANIYMEGTTIGTTTDETGHYMMINLPEGKHVIVAKAMGYKPSEKEIDIVANKTLEVNFELEPEVMSLDEVVVTGTKTFKRQTETPVIVNVLDNKTIQSVQACNISEGLQFQPGLRVETDCQTCNYTQLRMNGLGGGYSQILVNSRPIFSPLTGLYGMEQIPSNMVERIEVVRGGGSALYGSSAVGGTVNIITRIPKEDSYNLSSNVMNINGGAMDYHFNGNINMVTTKRNAGAAVFVNRRNREWYDHNDDNYSELPKLVNNSFGANLFYKPVPNQKIELNFTSLNEYRYGGEMVEEPAHLAMQSEERTHNVVMGGLDYQINFNDDNSSFITYMAGQYTDRDHYTGLFPVREEFVSDTLSETEIDAKYEEAKEKHWSDPPYGYTKNTTLQAGVQANHRLNNFLGGSNVITLGAEYVFDDVFDTIPAYDYEIDQVTKNIGVFFQSDWQVLKSLNLLAGARVDKHNLVDRIIASPRVSILYTFRQNTQFRFTWGTGFRAPQAFDSDMHIAFSGGGISRIELADNLREERSNSLSASVNYDKATERFIAGFTLEGFYTRLDNAFNIEFLKADSIGEVYVKRNSRSATVQGITLELRANYDRKAQLEAGYTFQSSQYADPEPYIENKPRSTFLRTPDHYGYWTLLFMPNERLNATFNGIYTGSMTLAHLAGAPGQEVDEYVTSTPFLELGIKAGYTFMLKNIDSGIEIFGGIKNLTNSYQNDFDTGRNRDSNYIYGPSLPRTFYLGIKLKSL